MKTQKNIAIYPGSFDPITNGHIDVINRGLKIFDGLVVAVARDIKKQPLFTVEERMKLIQEALGANPRVKVESFSGLLVKYAKSIGAKVILRGLRAISDFEYEFQMANMNKTLAPEVETLFMMTGERYFFISSQLVKEVVKLGGSVKELVPSIVEGYLKRKFNQ